MTWTSETIRKALDQSDMNVCKAVVTIYRRQTREEQGSYTTRVTNGVGFNKYDAEILTSFALQIMRNKDMGRRYLLSRAQMNIARKRIRKYSKQLARIANGEI